jgi:protocatechuate 3,4-dioxygenase beta subunit
MTELTHDEPDNGAVSRLLSRRRLLALGGAGAAAVGFGSLGLGAAADAQTATPVPAADPASCMTLTAEQIEGPYYLDYELFRTDVTEGRPGVPLRLALRVVDATHCQPVRNAAVEIWHCDAVGVYSGYDSATPPTPPSGSPSAAPTGAPPSQPPGGGGGGHVPPTNDLTFLRGMQLTDRAGGAGFRTVFPGWYRGRAIHIHVKVHTGGHHTSAGYVGGRTCHTGQFYFAESAATQLETLDPYATNTATRVRLDEDGIYPGGGATGGLLDLRYRPGHLSAGVLGNATLAVDPTATNTGE